MVVQPVLLSTGYTGLLETPSSWELLELLRTSGTKSRLLPSLDGPSVEGVVVELGLCMYWIGEMPCMEGLGMEHSQGQYCRVGYTGEFRIKCREQSSHNNPP